MKRAGIAALLASIISLGVASTASYLSSSVPPSPLKAADFGTAYQACTQTCTGRCCPQTCGYQACIISQSSRSLHSSSDVIDSGDAGAAMAACYPHIEAIKQCAGEANYTSTPNSTGQTDAPVQQQAKAVPTDIWIHAGPGSVSYSLTQHRATSIGGGRAGPEPGELLACSFRNQVISGEFKLSAPLPPGWTARARDNYRTFCTIEPGSNSCSFSANLGDGLGIIAEISDPRPNMGSSIASVLIKGTDDGQCHE